MPTQASRWDQGPSSHPGLCGAWYMCASDFWHDLLVLPIHQTVKDVFHWPANWVYIFRWLYKQTVGVWHLRFSQKWTLIVWSCLFRHWSQCIRANTSEKHTVVVLCHDPENSGVKWLVCPSVRWNLNHISGYYSILYYGEISKFSHTVGTLWCGSMFWTDLNIAGWRNVLFKFTFARFHLVTYHHHS
jgi:hypothetical protein